MYFSDAAQDMFNCMDTYYLDTCTSSAAEDTVTADIITYIKQFCDVDDDVTTIAGLDGSSIKSSVAECKMTLLCTANHLLTLLLSFTIFECNVLKQKHYYAHQIIGFMILL